MRRLPLCFLLPGTKQVRGAGVLLGRGPNHLGTMRMFSSSTSGSPIPTEEVVTSTISSSAAGTVKSHLPLEFLTSATNYLPESLQWLVTTLPLPGDPLLIICGLCAAQVAMGAFDVLFHHEFREKLPWLLSAVEEQRIHAIRTFVYIGAYAVFSGLVTPQGAVATAFAAALVFEVGITCHDFVVEDKTRLRYPWTERVTHTLMAINYGAVLGYLVPLCMPGGEWGLLPTGLSTDPHLRGFFTPLFAGSAGGLALWTLRDEMASRRLTKIIANSPLPSLQPILAQCRRGNATARLNVLIAGGSGFIGLHLARSLLNEGHQVTIITRDRSAAMRRMELMQPTINLAENGGGLVTMVRSIQGLPRPKKTEGDAGTTRNEQPVFDAVVNLTGESLAAGGRWTEQRKKSLYASRIGTTEHLTSWFAALPAERRPKVFLSGSAIGYYGVGIDEEVASESTPPLETKTLSHQLCEKWETTAMKAEEDPNIGIPTVILRTGVVLGRDGGALAEMLPIFDLFLGGRVGHGKQGMSWIHQDDAVRAIVWAMTRRMQQEEEQRKQEKKKDEGNAAQKSEIVSVVNLTAPNPVANNVFTKSLGQALKRPTLFPVPPFALRLMLGKELADELLLGGSKVRPAALLEGGFEFSYPNIEEALKHLCAGESCRRR